MLDLERNYSVRRQSRLKNLNLIPDLVCVVAMSCMKCRCKRGYAVNRVHLIGFIGTSREARYSYKDKPGRLIDQSTLLAVQRPKKSAKQPGSMLGCGMLL